MGNKIVDNAKRNTVFCSASGSNEKDRLLHLFNLEEFGTDKEARFNYFDELVNDDEALLSVLQEHNLSWPASIEMMESAQFLENLTNEQAAAILKALKI